MVSNGQHIDLGKRVLRQQRTLRGCIHISGDQQPPGAAFAQHRQALLIVASASHRRIDGDLPVTQGEGLCLLDGADRDAGRFQRRAHLGADQGIVPGVRDQDLLDVDAGEQRLHAVYMVGVVVGQD